jgi:hypothetical protein
VQLVVISLVPINSEPVQSLEKEVYQKLTKSIFVQQEGIRASTKGGVGKPDIKKCTNKFRKTVSQNSRQKRTCSPFRSPEKI